VALFHAHKQGHILIPASKREEIFVLA